MTHEEWVDRAKRAAKAAAGSPALAAAELFALADEVEALLPTAFSEWHVSQALSIAATVLEDTEPERALEAVTRQTEVLRQRLVGVADHLSSAASHRTLLLAKLGRLSAAKDSLGEALRAAALAPNPNQPLEDALAQVRKHADKPEQS